MRSIHYYLGMRFDFSFKNLVRINMMQYTSKVIEEFPEKIDGKSATPVADHLFKVRDNLRKCDEEHADAFHCTVYQLLILTNCSRQDIKTAVSFLTMRVQEPDKDNWGNLKRILKCLNVTCNLKLMLSADQLKFAVIGMLMDHIRCTKIAEEKIKLIKQD